MIPLPPLYLIIILELLILFGRDNPILSLPEAANKVAGYIEASTYKLERSYAKEHGYHHGFYDIPQVHQVRVWWVQFTNSQYGAPIVAYLTDVNAKISSSFATYKQQVDGQLAALSAKVQPFNAKVAAKLQPAVDYLTPYWTKAVDFSAPYVASAKSCLSETGVKLSADWDVAVDKASESLIAASDSAKQSYQTYAEPYVATVANFFKDNRHAVEETYSTKVAPFLDQYSEILTVIGFALFAYFVLPTILTYICAILKLFTEQIHDSVSAINSMHKQCSDGPSKPDAPAKPDGKAAAPAPSTPASKPVARSSSGASTNSTGSKSSTKSGSKPAAKKRNMPYTGPAKASFRTQRAKDASHEEKIIHSYLETSDVLSSNDPDSVRAARPRTTSSLDPPLTPEEASGSQDSESDQASKASSKSDRPSRQGSIRRTVSRPVLAAIKKIRRPPSPLKSQSPSTTLSNTTVYSGSPKPASPSKASSYLADLKRDILHRVGH